MSRIEIQLPQGYLDIDTNIGFGLTYSIDDIKNPTNRNTSFSKTITLPGTKSNNILMGGLFDINSDFTYFNPNFKTKAKITIDSTEVINGYLQLKNIKKLNNSDSEGNLIQYEVVVFDSVNNLFAEIGDKMLSDLNFSIYNHKLGHDAIVATWTSGHTWSTTTPYAYPHLFKDSTEYVTTDFKPAIFHKSYLTKIAETAGYSLGGPFYDDFEPYNHEIIPFCNKTLQMTEAQRTLRKFQASSNNASYTPYPDFGNSAGGSTLGGISNTTFTYTDGGAYGFDNNNNFGSNAWTVKENGKYNLTFQGGIDLVINPYGLTTAVGHLIGSGGRNCNIYLTWYKNGAYLGSSAQIPIAFPSLVYKSTPSTTTMAISPITILTSYNLVVGDVITTKWRFDTTAAGIGYRDSTEAWYSSSMTLNWSPLTVLYNDSIIWTLTDGDTIVLSDTIPTKLKQKDIFTDLIKRYNLFITIDPDNEKKLLLDTRENYYNSATSRLDWTDKKDYSSEDKIELLSELQKKKMKFTYTPDTDEKNKYYTDSTTDVYGVKKIEFDNEFVIGESVVQTPFSPTPIVYAEVSQGNLTGMIVPFLSPNITESNPRVLYYNGYMRGVPAYTYPKYTWVDSGGTSHNSHTTRYAYAGHVDNPWSPTIDLNYGQNPFYFINTFNALTNNNLYNKYWSSYINQIGEGRMVTSKFNLSELDISSIKNNLNTKIFVKDSWYFINKIIDYDPTKGDFTEVQLIKINEGVEFQFNSILSEGNTDISTVLNDGEVRLLSTVKGVPISYDYSNQSDSSNVLFLGSNNRVGTNNEGSIIIGNDNIVSEGFKGIIIGSGITTDSESNGGIILSNAIITSSGEIITNGVNYGDNGYIITSIDYELTLNDYLIEVTEPNTVITLPSGKYISKKLEIINASTGTITIETASLQEIGNQILGSNPTSFTLYSEEVLSLVSNGFLWRII